MLVATRNNVKDAAALMNFLNIQMKYVLYALLRWYFLIAGLFKTKRNKQMSSYPDTLIIQLSLSGCYQHFKPS